MAVGIFPDVIRVCTCCFSYVLRREKVCEEKQKLRIEDVWKYGVSNQNQIKRQRNRKPSCVLRHQHSKKVFRPCSHCVVPKSLILSTLQQSIDWSKRNEKNQRSLQISGRFTPSDWVGNSYLSPSWFCAPRGRGLCISENIVSIVSIWKVFVFGVSYGDEDRKF